jgi:hypothetical protein
LRFVGRDVVEVYEVDGLCSFNLWIPTAAIGELADFICVGELPFGAIGALEETGVVGKVHLPYPGG